MTQDQIERLAVKAGWPEEAGPFDAGSFSLPIFAALVEAAERERCAKLCDESADDDDEQFAAAARYLAAAIRGS